MVSIILTLIVIGILVTVHEGGHFIAARSFGVRVEKFSIGFGKALYSFTKGQTEYVIALIPLGGFVKMKGEDPDLEDKSTDSYMGKAWYKRAIIAFAGPFSNFIFALIIFILTFMIGQTIEDQYPVIGKIGTQYQSEFHLNDRITTVNGKTVRGWNDVALAANDKSPNTFRISRDQFKLEIKTPPISKATWFEDILPLVTTRIGDVTPGMPAYRAGLKSGDIILQVDSIKVHNWYEMRENIINQKASSVLLTIQRGNQIYHKKLDLDVNVLEQGSKMIGITQYLPLHYTQRASVPEAIRSGVLSTAGFIALNYIAFYKLLNKPEELKKNIGGPVMLVTMSQQSAKKGFDSILLFIASISIILMIMNLLPIPILDGGHIFFCIIEGIRGKALSLKTQIILQQIGLTILVFLMLYGFYADFSRIFNRALSLHNFNP
ncbi:MAG TPA: RIP metalloprotease RseP [Candidatus Cloacimonadota bacterium]|nr:RIP metalloprotease RseP [Candidatus Cloacimonadota bacterium]HPT71040.1 RIP metalloprotease RseP [Candidatus Cloacimonadota bacterium]